MTSEADHLGRLGEELSWVLEKALSAYERKNPGAGLEVVDAVKAGSARLRLTVTTGGGGQDSILEAAALDQAGNATLLARMSVAPFSLQ